MPIKQGNVLQSKAFTIKGTETGSHQEFMLPAEAMIVGLRAFGPNDTAGVIEVDAQTIDNSLGQVILSLITLTSAANGIEGTFAAPDYAYKRFPVPVKISAQWDTNPTTTANSWNVEIEYM